MWGVGGLKVKEFHLVADGLGATPLQEDLLDAAGAGNPETLRSLQFGFGVHRQRPTAVEENLDAFTPSWNSRSSESSTFRPHLLPASASSRSKTDLRA